MAWPPGNGPPDGTDTGIALGGRVERPLCVRMVGIVGSPGIRSFTAAMRASEHEGRIVSRFLRMPAVKHRLGCGKSTIYKLIAERKLSPPVKIGRASVWPEEDVTACQAELLRIAGRELPSDAGMEESQ